MSFSSPHLEEIERTARAGAHIVLRGHLHDEVMFEDRIVTERWALSQVLTHRAGLDAVVFADASDGIGCRDPVMRRRIESLLARSGESDGTGTPIGLRLGTRGAVESAMAARALLSQTELGVAFVLADLDLLINAADAAGRQAISLLRRAVEEAQCVRGRLTPAPRNLLVAIDAPESAAAEDLIRLPGVRLLRVAHPNRDTRLAVLRRIRRGFFSGDVHASVDAGIEVIADRTLDSSLRELEQLRRLSQETRIPATRPAALLSAQRGSQRANPFVRMGAERVATALEHDVLAQPRAHQRLRRLVTAAEHTAALGPHGSIDTRPLMTILAYGPPGVGKTETARSLARTLFGSERAYVRIDCGEFKNEHDAARLTGAPPGYIGYEGGGQLTEPLQRGPAVVLLDEFEKAHHDTIAKLLLGILDEGRLTDGRGETVSFEQAVLVITTNLGSKRISELATSHTPDTDDFLNLSTEFLCDLIAKDEDEDSFGRPELLSRLRAYLVGYDLLRREHLPALTAKYCENLAANLGDQYAVQLRIDDAGFAGVFSRILPSEGDWDARTLEQYVRSLIEEPLHALLESFKGGTAVARPGRGGSAVLVGAQRRAAE